MKLDIYKPTYKGISRGLTPDMRISFVADHYFWLDVVNGTYTYPTDGDVFEWKPGMRKPDSLWQKVDTVDVNDIAGYENMDKNNWKVFDEPLTALGYVEPSIW